MKYLCLLALALVLVAGCGTVENAAEEGKDAVQAGLRTKDKAKDYGAQKEAYDSQAADF
jgi:hypothetical protein